MPTPSEPQNTQDAAEPNDGCTLRHGATHQQCLLAVWLLTTLALTYRRINDRRRRGARVET